MARKTASDVLQSANLDGRPVVSSRRNVAARAMGSTAHIGSTPYASRSASMKATVTSVGGLAPPARKTTRPSAESRSLAGAPDSPAPASSPGPALRSSGPAGVPCHARLGAPNDAASRRCSRSCQPPTGSPPTASRADARDRTLPDWHAPGLPVSISSVFPWTTSCQDTDPLGNPGQFMGGVAALTVSELPPEAESVLRWRPLRLHRPRTARP